MVYNQLPEQVPIHWGIDGQIDRYGSKVWVYVTAFLPLAMFGLMKVIPKIDPRKDNYIKHADSYEIMVTGIILFMGFLHWAVILYSMGYNFNIIVLLKGTIGILFMLLGNYMPRIRHNYTLGIRTPWTLASESVWQKTHRAGGYGFMAVGLIWFLASPVESIYAFASLLGLLFLFVGWIFVYSYVLFRREGH
jgi:uncharacterized membrane protein